jgi:hypothetical protein
MESPDIRKSPVVLCIDFETYVCAVSAMETISRSCPDLEQRLMTAVADMKRAQAAYTTASGGVPALLRPQV